LSCTSCASPTATVTATTNYTVTATDPSSGCVASAVTSVSLFSFPNFTATATPSTPICAGTTVQLNAGVAAGNFSVTSIPYAGLPLPGSGVTNLVTNGSTTSPLGTTLSVGGLDDGGWYSIPLSFNFNFFGTIYSTVNISTNGNIQFGA